jgi:ParB family chromosome partitioning protein
MNNLSTARKQDITTWTKQDAQKAAQLGSHIGDAVVKMWQKAKDPAMVEAAVDAKLLAQRDFVLWWDAQENAGGNPTVTGRERLADFGIDRTTLHRWRSRLTENGAANDEKFERYRDQVLARCLKTIEAEMAANFSSESVQWYTPPTYLDAVRDVLGSIDLDPASCDVANQAVCAKEIFDGTPEKDGLKRQWHGRVFLNPPYGTVDGESLAGLFCAKAVSEYESGNVEEAVILVNSSHSQRWQAPLYDYAVCFVDHRIKFVSGDGEQNENPTFQNIFVYLGKDRAKFGRAFSRFGYVMERVRDD